MQDASDERMFVDQSKGGACEAHGGIGRGIACWGAWQAKGNSSRKSDYLPGSDQLIAGRGERRESHVIIELEDG